MTGYLKSDEPQPIKNSCCTSGKVSRSIRSFLSEVCESISLPSSSFVASLKSGKSESCHFGGRREWFKCPACATRARIRLYTTLANLSGALWRIRRANSSLAAAIGDPALVAIAKMADAETIAAAWPLLPPRSVIW